MTEWNLRILPNKFEKFCRTEKGNLAECVLVSYYWHMDGYIPRLVDGRLDAYLQSFGAVQVVGPKWVGKTTTCERHAASSFHFTPHAGDVDPLELAMLDSSYVFRGPKPRLIDEWQVMPSIWDMVRSSVDESMGAKGLYILTGSALPPQRDTSARGAIRHTGAGRIGRLHMSTMTLFETGESSGEVSLGDLFEGRPVQGQMRTVRLSELVHYIIRGGWPGNIGSADPSLVPRDYVELVWTSEIDRMDGPKADKAKFRRLLYSLARNESTVCSLSTLARDAGLDGKKLDEATVSSYLTMLSDLNLLDDQGAFSPSFRSRTRLKIGSKRHFADPSIAAAIVGAGEDSLIKDLQFLGFLFESLVEHDLRIYAGQYGGKLWHYQDYDNDEVDAVIELADGRFGLVEIKLGFCQVVDEAAKNLSKVAAKLERTPSFLAVVSGTAPAPITRRDGIHVIPLTSLGP